MEQMSYRLTYPTNRISTEPLIPLSRRPRDSLERALLGVELGALYVPASERLAVTVLAPVVRCATLLRQLMIEEC